jgi:DNA-binding NarL/FixJ family response regulator
MGDPATGRSLGRRPLAVTVAMMSLEGLAGHAVAAALRADRSVRVLASDLGADEVERAIVQWRPRVVIVDESVEHSLLVGLGARHPATGVVVLVPRPWHLLGTSLLEVGATCLARDSSSADLLKAVRCAAEGEPTFFAADARHVARRGSIAPEVLTPSQLKVFVHLARGRSYEEIGRELHLSPATVRSHADAICSKYHVKSKRELIGMRVPSMPAAELG